MNRNQMQARSGANGVHQIAFRNEAWVIARCKVNFILNNNIDSKFSKWVCKNQEVFVELPNGARGPLCVTFQTMRFPGSYDTVKKWDRKDQFWVQPKGEEKFDYQEPVNRRFFLKGILYYEHITRVETYEVVDK